MSSKYTGGYRTRTLIAAIPLILSLSCSRHLGETALPPGITATPGVFQDICPRWSHDGKRIAFLRQTADRRLQLCLTSADLKTVSPVGPAEVVLPDRAFKPGRASTYSTPDSIAWAPDDSAITIPRLQWLDLPDGQRMPGTGLWKFTIATRKMEPIAIPKGDESELYYYHSPCWSADGGRVAFIGEGYNGRTALFVRTIPGTSPNTPAKAFDTYEDVGWPAWSPDGKQLAFRRRILRSPTADPVDTIRICSPGRPESWTAFKVSAWNFESIPSWYETALHWNKTPDSRPVSERGTPRIADLAWSADGKRLAFSIIDSGNGVSWWLWWLNLEKPGPPKMLPLSDESDDRNYFAPVWLGHKTVLAIRTTGGPPYEVVRLPVDGERALGTGVYLPSDDLDWSPDRRFIVCSGPTNTRPAARTKLRVYRVE